MSPLYQFAGNSHVDNNDSNLVSPTHYRLRRHTNGEPGTLHHVWQEVTYGFPTARTKLHVVGEQEAQKGVLESKLAETM